MFNFSFNISEMFGHANAIIAGFMGLLTIVVGIAVGFRVVRFVKDLF